MSAPKQKPATPKPADADKKRKHREEQLDEALEESFPASDTPSMLTRTRKR